MSQHSFAEFLLAERVLDQKGLDRAKTAAKTRSLPLDRAVLALGLVEEQRLLETSARHIGCRFLATCATTDVDRDALVNLQETFVRHALILPLGTKEGIRSILTADPMNQTQLKEIGFYLGEDVKPVAAPSSAIERLVLELYTDPTANTLSNKDAQTLDEAAIDGPAVNWVNRILARAVDLGASDVHLSLGLSTALRYRINGLLAEQPFDRSIPADTIAARIKVMAGLNASERRLPQDGRIGLTVSGRAIDFRVSSVPTQTGESIVCRILDPKRIKQSWDSLGFDAQTAQSIVELIERPSGLFLVTGPTGSGKTTTLYTALAHLNTGARKIVTVEDPVEYDVDGIEQVQVNEAVGLTFGTVLRSLLRQDPDVLMIGEIRDMETAEIACRAALVGRLVLSTLHVKSPEAARVRLMDLGVAEYLVEEVLVGVLGQRLEVPSRSPHNGSIEEKSSSARHLNVALVV